MTMSLPHRRKIMKLKFNRKGFSSIIGTTVMVLVMMTLANMVFIWTLSKNTIYNEELRLRNQEEMDRRSENVVVEGNYSVSGNSVTIKAVLKNVGSIDVKIINLWVVDASIQKYANKSLNVNIKPGDTVRFHSNELTVIIPGAAPYHSFASWFITARGNTVPLKKEEQVIVAQVAQGIGSMTLDFYNFKYFTYTSQRKLAYYPNGSDGFDVPAATIAFGVVLANLDPTKKTITLDSHSQLWLYNPKSASSLQWYIVNVEADGTIKNSYTPITIAYGEKRLIVFASSSDGTFNSVSIPQGWRGELCAVNLLLHGTIDTRPYGQNIPFVSVFVRP